MQKDSNLQLLFLKVGSAHLYHFQPLKPRRLSSSPSPGLATPGPQPVYSIHYYRGLWKVLLGHWCPVTRPPPSGHTQFTKIAHRGEKLFLRGQSHGFYLHCFCSFQCRTVKTEVLTDATREVTMRSKFSLLGLCRITVKFQANEIPSCLLNSACRLLANITPCHLYLSKSTAVRYTCLAYAGRLHQGRMALHAQSRLRHTVGILPTG